MGPTMLCSMVTQSSASIIPGSARRALRSAIAVQAPAGNESSMPYGEAGQIAAGLDAAAGDEQAVERAPGAGLAGDAKAVRLGGLPVEQANDGRLRSAARSPRSGRLRE